MGQVASTGFGLRARLIRSSGWSAGGFLISQGLRLGSNLVLTRLLFPEAFGLMALITIFIVGLTLLSDIGVSPSIQQSARGDDTDFLDTAWTIQCIRGIVLWLSCFFLGTFAAWIYDDTRLELMLPVAGLTLLVSGFNPTRIETASRHLMLGRVTMLDVIAQVLSLAVMIGLSFSMRSVWALIIGGVIAAVIRLIIMQYYLPGPRNRFRWDQSAAVELINFGKWIFLSTLCGFALTQGDKAILGKYLSLEVLGIYNIGYFMAGFPQAMISKIMSQVMIPLHRECPPGASDANYAKVRKLRAVMTALVFAAQFSLAFSGLWIIALLYDDRFLAAGAVVVAVACMNVPFLIGMTYDFSALGQGDSRGVFRLLLVKATVQTVFFIAGMEYYGLLGAFAGLWVSQVLVHPFVIQLARRHGAWDPWHDLSYAVLGVILTALVLHVHGDALLSLQSLTLDQ
ncbi:polysaccharide biosynthesis protein [Salipiger sp. IMCC34102]|nr:polysaccharide biosynthesis protein [Salipiger sp. IMCC34102]